MTKQSREVPPEQAPAEPEKKPLKFPTAFTVLAAVLLLVWVASFFVPAGAYKIEVDRLMRYSGWHLLGTARMGDDPTSSVVDRWNRAHDVSNLYVVDGSCFVTSSGVNPTSTIVAIALRAAEHMVETRFEQQVPA